MPLAQNMTYELLNLGTDRQTNIWIYIALMELKINQDTLKLIEEAEKAKNKS